MVRSYLNFLRCKSDFDETETNGDAYNVLATYLTQLEPLESFEIVRKTETKKVNSFQTTISIIGTKLFQEVC